MWATDVGHIEVVEYLYIKGAFLNLQATVSDIK